MKNIIPEYYKKFKCIADKCRHNCCIGWEIDIDEETAKKYSSLNTPLGDRIRNNTEGNPPHFLLKEKDRCPFLNENNLCDIITELGEEGLCDICSLHPRFRNFYSDFTETGLGLCCEEAVRILLSEKEKFNIEIPEGTVLDEDESVFFAERQHIFDILQNRDESVLQRFDKLSAEYGFEFEFDASETADYLISLERLDECWTTELQNLAECGCDKSIFERDEFSTPLEQLAVYFIFRHLPKALGYFDYADCAKFALVSCYVIGLLWQFHKCNPNDDKMLDIVRMYSSEIEYSEENTESLMEF